MFTPMLNQFPLLRHVKPEQWDVVITIAGVFIAATRLRSLKIDDAREEELMDIVASGLIQRNPNYGVRGFEDCKAMFERTFDGLSKAGHEPQFIASDALGIWVVWNLLERSPGDDEEERKLVRTIGTAIVHAFFSWWTDEVK
jgi:hypothetical protein